MHILGILKREMLECIHSVLSIQDGDNTLPSLQWCLPSMHCRYQQDPSTRGQTLGECDDAYRPPSSSPPTYKCHELEYDM